MEKLLARQQSRLLFNEQELKVSELFEQYDVDGSGAIDFSEMKKLLTDLQRGVEPSQRELEWIMKTAGKDESAEISEAELRDALLAWHGFVHLPQEYKDLFAEFDWDESGALDVSELQGLLTRVSGTDVSETDAAEVLKKADVLTDGVINKEELLGAVGTWYVNVGRQPTRAMLVAFTALNHTPRAQNCCCVLTNVCVNAMLGYFALDAAIGAGYECGHFLPNLLLADGILWLIYALFLVMAGRWVQALNICLPLAKAARWISHIAGAIVVTELVVLLALILVECVGLYLALAKTELGEAGGEKCFRTNTTENAEGLPSNLVNFSNQWFELWALPSSVLAYIFAIYSVIKIRRAFKRETFLQADFASSDEESGTDSSDSSV